MPAFVGGVMAEDEQLGFVQVGGERLTAVDLASGEVLWQRKSTARPVAATLNFLVAVDTSAGAPCLLVLGANDGGQRAVVTDSGMPDWAASVVLRPGASEFAARENARGLELDWRLEYRYRGGAAPRRRDQAAHAQDSASGRVVIELATGSAESASMPVPAQRPVGAAARVERGPSAPDLPTLPGEVARTRTRRGDYFLRTVPNDAQGLTVTLEVHHHGARQAQWKADLGTVARSRPPPLPK